MSININKTEKPSPAVPITATIAGAAVGGLAIGKETKLNFDPDRILAGDKFELSEKLSKKLSESQKDVVDDINKHIDLFKKSNTVAAEKAGTLFNDKEAMPLSEFLNTDNNTKPMDKVKTFFSKLFKKSDEKEITPETIIADFEKNIENQSKKLDKQQEAFESGVNEMSEQLKTKNLDKMSALDEKIRLDKHKLNFVNAVKKENVTKESYVDYMTNLIKDQIGKSVKESLDSLKNITQKTPSMGKAFIGGTIGLITGLIIANTSANKANKAKNQLIN